MASRDHPKSKKTPVPKSVFITKQFKKDWERLTASNLHDLRIAKEGISLLCANEGPLPREWFDHPLSGKLKGYRDFHAKGDLVVIYKDDGDELQFIRIGTHSEIFE